MENSHLPDATQAAYTRILDGLRITDQSALERILKVLAMLDDIRWGHPVNSTSVNYSSDDLTADEKLLTHWLCYITDRQMPFRRIWEVGGYVFSNLVQAYTSEPELGVQDLLHRYLRQEKGRWRFECDLFDAADDAAKRLGPFGAVRNGKVSFASRYIPDDVVRIAHTLMFLDRVSNRSLARFMANALPDPPNADDNRRHTIRRLAAALDVMTYLHGGSPSVSNYGQQITSLPETMENYVRSYVEQRTQTLDSWLEGFYPFGRKRLWCSLRDYLKSPELNAVFVSALEQVGFADSRSWLRDNSDLREALDAMELPG